MRISSSDIKVKINYPEQYELDENIQSTIAKWILNQQIDRYGELNLEIIYNIWFRVKEIELDGVSYEEAKKMAIDEYIK